VAAVAVCGDADQQGRREKFRHDGQRREPRRARGALVGRGRGVDDFAFVKVATGVGSGHFIGGQIYRGATGTAGEIGHLAIDPHGAPCVRGLRGCLTTLVGSQALVARASALARNHRKSALAKGRVTIPRSSTRRSRAMSSG
jgi:hypothetical protein